MTDDHIELGRTQELVSPIGEGTWGIGGYSQPDHSADDAFIKVIIEGIKAGMTVIDTAEIYANGHAEDIVGKAVREFRREDVFIIDKVWPTHLSADLVNAAVKHSLSRLGTPYIDLLLVHWPNPAVPLRETLGAMERLVDIGMVRYIGVSNFDVTMLADAMTSLSKHELVANEVKYSIMERGVERDLLPFCRNESISLIAYTPLAKGSLAKDERLSEIGRKYEKSAAQVALNWLISHKGIIAIPKAASIVHVKENAGAMGWRLSEDDIKRINNMFESTL